MRRFSVYMVTNLINGERYIGVTGKPPRERMIGHFSAAETTGTRTPLARSIREYGREMFRITVLITCATRSDANVEEARLIRLLAPEYNVRRGGDSRDGRAPQTYQNWRPGVRRKYVVSALFRRVRAEVNARPERKLAWAERLPRVVTAAITATSRPVICLNDGARFPSASSAARHYGVLSSALSRVCRKKALSVGGLVFRFDGDRHRGAEEAAEVLARVAAFRLNNTSRRPRKVRCIDDGLVYPTIVAAAKAYGAHHHAVRQVCLGRAYKTTVGRRFEFAAGAEE